MDTQESIKRRKQDNGIRRYINPGWAIAVLMMFGMFIAYIAKESSNASRITKVETDIVWIREGISEIKDILRTR